MCVKVSKLSFDEMFRDVRCNRQDGAVRHRRNFGDNPVVVANEAQVRNQRGKAVPPGERSRLDHDPAQLSRLFDIGVYEPGDRLEIAGLDCTLGPNQQNAFVS